MLHPLTVKLFSNAPIGIDDTIRNYDKIIRQYLSERAMWFKTYFIEDRTDSRVDLAFELEKKEGIFLHGFICNKCNKQTCVCPERTCFKYL